MADEKKTLPANAYTVLKPGEKYVPFVPPSQAMAEVTGRSVGLGLFMAVLFTFACTYSGLKAGQVLEAAIPISILAVGISGLMKRKSSIGENVIIQSIGASSGVVVAGAIFTIPALFMIKDANPKLYHVFLSALLGGALGVLFMIPLRRYFMVEQHGTLPFPEATATTEILVSGEAGGKQAKVLAVSMAVGGLFDFLVETVTAWNASLKTTLWGFGQALHDKTKLVVKMQAQALFLGLGYIVGLRYAAVICAGSFLAWWVLVPLVGYVGAQLNVAVPPGTIPASQMGADQLFKFYVRYIGIGAIAAAGILGIIKNSKIIYSSFSLGIKEIFAKKGGDAAAAVDRTDLDISMKYVMLGIAGLAVGILVFFGLLAGDFAIGAIGLAVALTLSFLFTTVAALATATVGTNPVSGMTLVTLILASVTLVRAGVSGTGGILVALVIGGVVCTSLSVAGGFVTDLKTGYWIGTTPRNQERWKFLGILVAAACAGLAILMIDKAFGFALPDGSSNPAIPAPQANVMKSIITSLMDPTQQIPWMLYGIGIFVTIVMEMAKVPPLAFALGMYLPMELNTPLLVGGLVAHLVSKDKDAKLAEARFQRGTLIASGFIAGASIFGVIGATLRTFDAHRFFSVGVPVVFNDGKKIWEEADPASWFTGYGHLMGLAFFIALAAWMYWESRKAEKE